MKHLINLEGMSTETRNPNTMHLDEMSIHEILTIMNEEDQKVPLAIKKVLPQIEQAVTVIDQAFKKGGRLIYIGAGTSGRLGVLDAAECVPTFGTSPEMVQGLIAGGQEAMMFAVEGAEDSQEMAKADLTAIELSADDVVVGIAASGRTPYVIGGLNYANQVGAHTVSIACNKESEIGKVAKIVIEAVPGPEVLTGSTRLKAGTVQKLILNMLSTVSMVKQGKVYQNLMVDVQATNEKLVRRSQKIVCEATGVSLEVAKQTLTESQGDVKTAILMIILDIDFDKARILLEKSEGHIREAIRLNNTNGGNENGK